MTTTKQVPVLGIDTTAWLTSRIDGGGCRTFYVVSGTANQRLNLPPGPLMAKVDSQSDELVEIQLETEFVSGMNAADSVSRKTDYMFACSRCGTKAMIANGQQFVENCTPLIIRSGVLCKPCTSSLNVRLTVTSVLELAEIYCSFIHEPQRGHLDSFPLTEGTILVICNGIDTGILKLDSKIRPGEFEATFHSQSSKIPVAGSVLEMPTFGTPRPIGEIMF